MTATTVVDSEDATGFLEVVAQRLRAAADAALTEPPATLEDPATDGDACLAALVDRLSVTGDPALAWLVLTALAGAYPSPATCSSSSGPATCTVPPG